MNLPDNPKQAAWAYITQAYAKPGVEAACLKLQDNHGINVTYLLFLMWCEETGRTADGSWQNLYRAGQAWRGLARFLRTIRHWASGKPKAFLLRYEIYCENRQLCQLVENIEVLPGQMPAKNLIISYLEDKKASKTAAVRTILKSG